MKKILLSVAFMLLVFPAVFNTNDISAQTVSVKVGTGQVTLVTYQRGEPLRWNILLININTGAMWAIDTK